MSPPSTSVELEQIVEESAVFEVIEDRSAEETIRSKLRDRHWTMLILSTLVLAVSLAVSVRGSGEAGAVTWLGIELPVLCGSRAWFGIECPGCGLTRSFVALAAGDFTEAYRFHRVGWLLWLAVVMQIPFRVYSLWEMRTSTLERQWPDWFGYFLIAALLGNWVLKVFSI